MEAGSLVLEGISKVFDTPERRPLTAVDAVSLSIGRGEFVTLLGPSGCGKTTTLRLIAGFEFPSAGRILLDSRDIANVPPNKRQMAVVFQSYALFPHLSVFENVAYGLRLKPLREDEIRSMVRETLALVNLPELGQRSPAQLSGGQQQRVALARALAVRPKVLLFDEPLSNLDAKLRVSLRAEIRRLQQQLGITSVYVTHDQAEAMSLSDRVVVMNAGRVQQVGTPADVYRRPSSRFVADFIGRANFIETSIVATHGEAATVSVFGQRLEVPAPPGVAAGEPAWLVIRPEAVRLSANGTGFPGQIKAATYLGSTVEYELTTGDQTLSVADHESAWGQIFSPGDAVHWSFLPERAYLLRR